MSRIVPGALVAFVLLSLLGCVHREEVGAPLDSMAMVGFDEFETPLVREQYEVLRYVRDPIEPFNRGSFSLTRVFMEELVRPVALGWRLVFPRPVRAGIDNFSYNLGYPNRLVALLLQAKWQPAADETKHFAVNTTVGLAGVLDVARELEIPTHPEDIGQAVGHWGVGPGFYFFIPLLGPSSGRDALGRVVDTALTPSTYVLGTGLVFSINSMSSRIPTIDSLSDHSTDLYPSVRTLWALQREIEVTDYTIADEAWRDADPDPSLGVMSASLRDPQFALDATRGEVRLPETSGNLPYSLWLQEQPAPLLFVVPSIGAHRTATPAVQIAESAFARGWSVAIVSSPFHPEFILEGLTAIHPGYTPSDAQDLLRALRRIRDDVGTTHAGEVTGTSLVGYSLGGMQAIFAAALDRKGAADEQLGFASVVAVNPPAQLEYAASQFDRYFQVPAQWPEPERDRRVIDIAKRAYLVNAADREELERRGTLPFAKPESQFLIGTVGRAVTLGAIRAGRQRGGKNLPPRSANAVRRDPAGPVSEALEAAALERYVKELALPYVKERFAKGKSVEELSRAASLQSQEQTLRRDARVRVLTNRDDFVLAKGDLAWLERTLGDRLSVHPSGGHLGNLHTPELQAELMDALRSPRPEDAIPGD